jgi:hypothetical protein
MPSIIVKLKLAVCDLRERWSRPSQCFCGFDLQHGTFVARPAVSLQRILALCLIFACLLHGAFQFRPSAKAAISNPNGQSHGRAAVMDGKTDAEGRQAHDVQQSAVNREHPVIFSEFSAVDVVPDGNLNKEFWIGAKRIQFDEAGFSRRRHTKAGTLVASRWTRQYLYLA